MDYKYDIAFSFLAQDEVLTLQLSDLLKDRFRTFVYSKSQETVAGTDGEKTFHVIFGEQARLVVVLYRKEWGQTPWTRIEETAIRNRAYEHGYDFVKFIPLDAEPTAPAWLPKTQLWLGLKRYGLEGAASVIEARVQELGGDPHEETVEDRAARLDRARQFSFAREKFLNSMDGVSAAAREFAGLGLEIERLIASVNSSASFSLVVQIVPSYIVVRGPDSGLTVSWRLQWGNSLSDAKLVATLWDGLPLLSNEISFGSRKALSDSYFTFDLLPTEQPCWVASNSSPRQYATKDLASHVLKSYLDHLERCISNASA